MSETPGPGQGPEDESTEYPNPGFFKAVAGSGVQRQKRDEERHARGEEPNEGEDDDENVGYRPLRSETRRDQEIVWDRQAKGIPEGGDPRFTSWEEDHRQDTLDAPGHQASDAARAESTSIMDQEIKAAREHLRNLKKESEPDEGSES